MVDVHASARQAAPFSDDITHPIILLCRGDRESRSAFREFLTAFKALSLTGVTAQEKLNNVEAAYIAAARLRQADSESERRLLKHELLQVAVEKEASPLLWEQLAEAALASYGLKLLPYWGAETCLKLPEITSIESVKPNKMGTIHKVEVDIPSRVSDAWIEACAAVPSGAPGQVSFEESMAALRCHILLMRHGANRIELLTAEQRLTTFLREGLDRWNQLLQNALSQNEADSEALKEAWGAPLQRWVLMRLQHQVAVRSGVTLSGELHLMPQPGSRVQLGGKNSLQVIHGPIPPSASREDAAGLAELEPLTKHVPVKAMPTLSKVDAVVHGLQAEFPWAEQATELVGKLLRVRCLFGSPDLALPPILLVGPPGCGKSRLARRIAELLELPFHPVAVGGTTDAKQLIGTSRGWGGACASPLLIPLLANKTASALVLLDEIDKAGRNGDVQPNMTSALLGFLEPETAARHHDSFLQTTCDFSRLLFIATANSLKMPKALLSRFQILYVPEPRKQDMSAIARGALIDMAKDLGIPADFLPEPPAHLLEQSGGNARSLKALLMGFLHEWACMHLDPARLN